MLILLITFADAFPTKNQTSKIQDYSNDTESTMVSIYSASFFENTPRQDGPCCDSGCFVNCSQPSTGGSWFLDNEARKLLNSSRWHFTPTRFAMKARRPHRSMRHGVLLTIMVGGQPGHYSLVLNLAHAFIAIRSK